MNRKQRRIRVVERKYTRPGMQIVNTLENGEVVHRKAGHVVNDYTYQREKPDPKQSNYVRHQVRKRVRQIKKEVVK